MPSGIKTNRTDNTMLQKPVAAGMDTSVLWMCTHKSRNGQYRKVPGLRPIAWRCLACKEKGVRP